ncbi:hypothetical protein [Flavobacterium sp.]|uniref:hypothetical protein n=1 Tax=Flavobacterium sp. TaxID=239 RepID=UPI0040340723
MSYLNFTVPDSLRKKYVSSEVSRQIFFLDCINDLLYCSSQASSYHMIRASVPLRILLLDGGLKTILRNDLDKLVFMANENIITGTALTKKDIRNIKNLEPNLSGSHRCINYLYLSHAPLRPYSFSEFTEKICLQINTAQEFNFSVQNVIEIVANKHGGAHLEAGFSSLTIESFMMGNFSPFAMKEGNFFLEKIKEILFIFIVAIGPACKKIIESLQSYDANNMLAESSNFAYVMTFEGNKRQKENED